MPQLTDLARLTDRLELTDLASRLGRWLDDGRFDDAHELFTEGARVETPGGIAHGVERIADQARRNHADTRTQHVITNALVDLDGDRATIGANLVVAFAQAGAIGDLPAPHFTLGERYELEAARTALGWRLTSLRTVPIWQVGSR